MKPFDLEAAKRGEPICTRDGRDVKFIAHVPETMPHFRLIVLIKDCINFFPETGIAATTGNCVSDLFMKPKKKTVWVNLYRKGTANYHPSEDEANLKANKHLPRIGDCAYPLEIEE